MATGTAVLFIVFSTSLLALYVDGVRQSILALDYCTAAGELLLEQLPGLWSPDVSRLRSRGSFVLAVFS